MAVNKLNIALIGYGKMGKTLEKVAKSRGHEIGLVISSKNQEAFNSKTLQRIDVAIEFTRPDSARNNLIVLAKNKVPSVCGTTAWLEDYEEVCESYKENKTGFIYASNFSIGVNVLFNMNKQLASIMNSLTEYDVKITESHHLTKLDAPSGTAVTLAEQITERLDRKEAWTLEDAANIQDLEITAIREKDVKGDHEIKYTSGIDEITLRHEAFSRDGFALGAIIAAEYICDKNGIHTMSDVLNLATA